jgi:flagellum-specific ATP synthase
VVELRQFREKLCSLELSPTFATITKIGSTNLEAQGMKASVGDIIRIVSNSNSQESLGMVTAVSQDSFHISPFGFVEGFCIRDRVYGYESGLKIPIGEAILGRVVNPMMQPIDDGEPLNLNDRIGVIRPPVMAMRRGLIDEVFSVGVKTIDGLLTCGKGQKLGIFAGSGVGKSTLMGMLVRGAQATIKVVALIGERGREVPEFVEKNLGGDLTNTVIVVATSDDSALMRKYGAFAAMSVAEYFKEQGHDVLFMMDSVTRFAMAQREIGLALGEPPTTKGYPPSVFALLPQLMERAGKEEGKGSITAFFTVLVEGDDMILSLINQDRF